MANLVTITQAAKITGISKKELHDGVNDGWLPSYIVGGKTLVDPEQVVSARAAHAAETVQTYNEIEAVSVQPAPVPSLDDKPVSVTSFESKYGTIRTVMIDGDPWFVAKDVSDALGYANNSKAIADHVDDMDKGVTNCYTLGGTQSMVVINESGLYSLALTSKLPEAKDFKRWVTSEVLPSLRKHGMYAKPETLAQMLASPESVVQMLTALQNEQSKVRQLEAQREKDKPMLDFAASFAHSDKEMSVSDLHRLLQERGLPYNRKEFFAILHKDGYLISSPTNAHAPSARERERSIKLLVERMYKIGGYGEAQYRLNTRVTMNGFKHLAYKYLGKEFDLTRNDWLTMMEGQRREQALIAPPEDKPPLIPAPPEQPPEPAAPPEPAVAPEPEAKPKCPAVNAQIALGKVIGSFGPNPQYDYLHCAAIISRHPDELGAFTPKAVSMACRRIGLDAQDGSYLDSNRHRQYTTFYKFPVAPGSEPPQPEPAPESTAEPPVQPLSRAEIANVVNAILSGARSRKDTEWRMQTTHEFMACHPSLCGILPHEVEIALTTLGITAETRGGRIYRKLPYNN